MLDITRASHPDGAQRPQPIVSDLTQQPAELNKFAGTPQRASLGQLIGGGPGKPAEDFEAILNNRLRKTALREKEQSRLLSPEELFPPEVDKENNFTSSPSEATPKSRILGGPPLGDLFSPKANSGFDSIDNLLGFNFNDPFNIFGEL
jgi:hypothetical protein